MPEAEHDMHLTVKVTGHDVYRAVQNYVRNEIKIDVKATQRLAISEAQAAANQAVEAHLKTCLGSTDDLERLVRRVISTLVLADAKETIRRSITWHVEKIVQDRRSEIEHAIRTELETPASGFLVQIAKDAIQKIAAKKA